MSSKFLETFLCRLAFNIGFLIRVRVVRRLVGEMRAEFCSLLSLSTELRLYCRTRYDASKLKPAFDKNYYRRRFSVMVTGLFNRKLILVSLGSTAALPRVVITAPVPAAPPAPAPMAAPFPPPAIAPIIAPSAAPPPI